MKKDLGCWEKRFVGDWPAIFGMLIVFYLLAFLLILIGALFLVGYFPGLFRDVFICSWQATSVVAAVLFVAKFTVMILKSIMKNKENNL